MRACAIILLLGCLCVPLFVTVGTSSSISQEAISITQEERTQEIAEKVQRVVAFLKERELSGLLLSTTANFAWITGGGDNHVVIASEEGTCSILILLNGERYLISNSSEAGRIMEEELQGLGFSLKVFKWYEDKLLPDKKWEIIKGLTRGGRVAADIPYSDAVVVKGELGQLRYPLTDSEIKKYRWLGRECAQAVDNVCRTIQPGMSEKEIEALISDELLRRGIRPTVILVGVDDRIYNYRHAIPTEERLQKYAMINICARRWGLVIATTRLVHFGPVHLELGRRMKATAQVAACYLAHSQPGRSAADILKAAQEAYADAGYPGEWERHHQGGATGYQERDWLAYPGSPEVVHSRQAFAWNPTITGAKVEDTVIIYDDHIEVLTRLPDWPTIKVEYEGKVFLIPDILIR
ncbi:MAG: M24 family metallopeptidase [Acidobacteriota bacterium]